MASTRRLLTEYGPVIFWASWALVALLQGLDALSVALAGHLARELNPLVLRLAARYGVGGALLIKLVAAGAWLALVAGLFGLALRLGSRALAVVCLTVVVLGALYSAVVFWNNTAAVLFQMR